MCYRIRYVFIFKARHTYLSIKHLTFSYIYTMFIMSYMCISFFYYAAPWLLFTYINAPHTSQKLIFTLCLAKTFAIRYFVYVAVPSYLYFSYLAFNVHASNFPCNYTFITFEISINVFSRFKENSSSTTHVAQYYT